MTLLNARSDAAAAQSSIETCARWSLAHNALLCAILAVNVLLKAPNLGHAALRPMDESFHALVARNLLYHPLEPTLIREPVLPYDRTDWLNNHIWLHKPILPLWIMALSLKCLGISPLAIRLPSLVLSTAAVLLTYLITRRVYGAAPGLIAAAFQAVLPAIGMVVQGYVFSDAIDVNLLFWSELSLWLMLLPNRKWIWLSGAAAGAAFLSKTFPALFVIAPLALSALLRGYAPGSPRRVPIHRRVLAPTATDFRRAARRQCGTLSV